MGIGPNPHFHNYYLYNLIFCLFNKLLFSLLNKINFND